MPAGDQGQEVQGGLELVPVVHAAAQEPVRLPGQVLHPQQLHHLARKEGYAAINSGLIIYCETVLNNPQSKLVEELYFEELLSVRKGDYSHVYILK